jgi:heme exporter protein CcmD
MSFFDLPHVGFVIAAYAVAAIVVGFLIGSIVIEHRSLRRALAVHQPRTPDAGDPDGVVS